MNNLKQFEDFNLYESEPGDETPYWVDQAIKAILPIMEDYARSVDVMDGDADNAFEHIKQLIIQEIEKL